MATDLILWFFAFYGRTAICTNPDCLLMKENSLQYALWILPFWTVPLTSFVLLRWRRGR